MLAEPARTGCSHFRGIARSLIQNSNSVELSNLELPIRRFYREQDDRHIRIVAPPVKLRLEPIFDDDIEQ